MIKIYGMSSCPDCTYLDSQIEGNPNFEKIDIGLSTADMKTFLRLRDTNAAFSFARRFGMIGIPCFVLENGKVTLKPEDVGLERRPVECDSCAAPEIEETDRKQVLLLGDSLRMGYEPVVRKLLEDKADVFGPNENGRWAGYTLNSLRFWRDTYPTPDVIHWNNGLWDLGDDYELNRPFSTPEEYESALERTVTVLRKMYPGVKIIMASIMPTARPETEGIMAYNKIMKEVAERNDIPFNDLFPIVYEHKDYIGPDTVHLTEEGFNVVGKQVAAEIDKLL